MRRNRSPIGGERTHPRANNLEDLRRQNLSTVLRLVHAQRSLSRADLTRATGLNRSTIATIVGELERMQHVVASEPRDTKRVGRPSTVIEPSRRYLAIAVNPEIDAISVGIVAMGGHVLRSFRFESERVPLVREVVNTVAALLDGLRLDLSQTSRVTAIGVAVPGLVGAEDGIVRIAPHLEWRDESLVELMSAATGLPVFAANDATCGVVAEAQFGAGAGADDIVYLNGGASGIGGGVISDGMLLTGRGGFGGELGHTLVNSVGRVCHCGAVGCLETEVARAELLAAVGLTDSGNTRLGELLVEAYGVDPIVREVVDRQVDFLAIALRNIVNTFNPELVVLGGFLTTLFDVAGDRLNEVVRASALPGPATDVRIVPTALGRDDILIGAADFALRPLLDDPSSVLAHVETPADTA